MVELLVYIIKKLNNNENLNSSEITIELFQQSLLLKYENRGCYFYYISLVVSFNIGF